MDLSIEWLKSFVDIGDVTPLEFSHRMTMTGSKVESWSSEADKVKNVVTGKVLSLERHPDSDHLWVCAIDIGAEKPLQIVTGAQNLHGGEIVPVALDNSDLPSGAHITSGKLRGVDSRGMLCSLGELGLTKHDFPDCIEDGIMVLPADTPVGEDIVKTVGLDDIVVEFEITPNRPDCLSVLGLAREAAVTFDKPLNYKAPVMPQNTHGNINELLHVRNETPDTCSRYTAAIVDNVRVKPSPEWMRARLRHSGVRPINNIVDITNYVMLEMGQPMHAFDLRNVKDGQIVVRRAAEGEEIETLDGVQRKLTPDMTVIADSEKPIAVAGVMGGEYSSITDDTTSIIFESACFNGPNVRMTAKALGMRTESSARFEKGLDPYNTEPALTRALELIALLDAGDVVGGMVDAKGDMPTPPHIKLDCARVNRFLGTDVSDDFMVETLKKLQFDVTDDLIVTPPTFRGDVEGFADLAEEVARFYGYNLIPSTVMSGVAAARPTERQRLNKSLMYTMTACGMWEINTYSFMSAKQLDALCLPADDARRKAVVISNPFGEDTSLMRTTALSSFLEVVSHNYNARVASAWLFESAVVFEPNADTSVLPTEHKILVAGGYGAGFDFYALKGVADKVLGCYRVEDVEFRALTNDATYHPGRTAEIYVKGTKVGVIGELRPEVCTNYGIKDRVVVFEMDEDVLFELRGGTIRYHALPKFPALTRDLAVVCDLSLESAVMEAAIRRGCGKLLESLKVFDVYTGDRIESGKKSVAYSLVLRDVDGTLTDEHADGAIARSLEELKKIGAVLRG